MAVLQNPYAGDDPDPEDEPETHAPGCRCDICTEERAIYGDDYGADDGDPDDYRVHPESCMCERCL